MFLITFFKIAARIPGNLASRFSNLIGDRMVRIAWQPAGGLGKALGGGIGIVSSPFPR